MGHKAAGGAGRRLPDKVAARAVKRGRVQGGMVMHGCAFASAGPATSRQPGSTKWAVPNVSRQPGSTKQAVPRPLACGSCHISVTWPTPRRGSLSSSPDRSNCT